MTQTQKKIRQSRERRRRRDMACLVASQIAVVQDFQGRPESAELGCEVRKLCAAFIIGISANLDNPADYLRMVADAREGKLPAAKFDNAIKEAYWRAQKTGKRKDERSNPFRPFLSEVDDALTFVLTEMGYTKQPTKDALRRRLKILGLRLSPDKPGQHRKRRSK